MTTETIQERIKSDMKEAMKAKDAMRLSVLRGLISAFTNEAITIGKTPQDPLTDAEAVTVIKRAAKQRKDSIEQFDSGGRTDLSDNERAELKVIDEYLPEMMSEEAVREFVKQKAIEMGVKEKSGFGQFMGAVMKELKDKADGQIVKKVVEEVLS